MQAGGSSSSSSSSSAVFKTAREAGTVGQAVLEAYKLIRRALRECNEQMKGEPGGKHTALGGGGGEGGGGAE